MSSDAPLAIPSLPNDILLDIFHLTVPPPGYTSWPERSFILLVWSLVHSTFRPWAQRELFAHPVMPLCLTKHKLALGWEYDYYKGKIILCDADDTPPLLACSRCQSWMEGHDATQHPVQTLRFGRLGRRDTSYYIGPSGLQGIFQKSPGLETVYFASVCVVDVSSLGAAPSSLVQLFLYQSQLVARPHPLPVYVLPSVRHLLFNDATFRMLPTSPHELYTTINFPSVSVVKDCSLFVQGHCDDWDDGSVQPWDRRQTDDDLQIGEMDRMDNERTIVATNGSQDDPIVPEAAVLLQSDPWLLVPLPTPLRVLMIDPHPHHESVTTTYAEELIEALGTAPLLELLDLPVEWAELEVFAPLFAYCEDRSLEVTFAPVPSLEDQVFDTRFIRRATELEDRMAREKTESGGV